MPERDFILASLPIIFMLHDFEEIILMRIWFERNQIFLEQKFPRLGQRMIKHFNSLSTESFAFGVAEEFVILSLISLTAIVNPSWLLVWFGFFAAFTIHLIYHILTAIVLRKYVAAVLTRWAFLPICLYLMFQFLAVYRFGMGSLIVWTVLALIIVIANGIFIHSVLCPKFERFLSNYRKFS